MNKRKTVKGLLFALFAACFIFGGSFLKTQEAEAASLPRERENLQTAQAFHTVTFVVNGEVYALYEYVEDNVSLGDTMLGDVQLAGYDFLGWTYGDGQAFTKDTLITSDLTVTAVLRVNAYMVGGNYYETLDEAYVYAGEEEIVLVGNVDKVHLKEGAPTLNLNGNSVGDILIESGKLTLYGGTVTRSITLVSGTLEIKGGSFVEDVTGYLADGYHCIKTADVYNVGEHESEAVKGYAATCEESGLTDGEKCRVCGEILLSQELIDALGHQAQILDEIPATCQTQGKTEGSHCSVCGEILKAQESTPITAHFYQDGACVYCGEREKEETSDESLSSSESTEGTDSAINFTSESTEETDSVINSSFQSAEEEDSITTSSSENTAQTNSVENTASSESGEKPQAKGCASFIGLSFGGWIFVGAVALCFKKKIIR